MNDGNATYPLKKPPGSSKDTGVEEESIVRNHPIYWFDDGSLVLDVEVQRFRVHRTLLSRHSRFFASLSSAPHDISVSTSGSPTDHIVLEPRKEVRAEDVEALLQHLYHDVPLGSHSSFSQVASILRVSSPKQLDFPHIHAASLTIFENMFPVDPSSFTHSHPLHEALPLATELKVYSARKAILYSLVTTTDFDATEPTYTPILPASSSSKSQDSKDEPNSTTTVAPVGVDQAANNATVSENPLPCPVLSPGDAEICMTLMTRFIEHFTPVLFTAAATPHMTCTNVFADRWMPLVIQPALNDDGVYKPLETLERIKRIDWAEEGLCPSCVEEKREEWTEEQRTVWRLMDSWLEFTPLHGSTS